MIDRSFQKVAGTGQRPQHMRPAEAEWGREQTARVMKRLRDEYATEIVISGLALGFDQWLAIAGVAEGCELHAYMPFPGELQSQRWNDADKAAHQSLERLATYKRFEADTFEFQAYHRRNQAMVDAADLMVILTNGKRSGGTWDCIGRIVRAGVPSILIHTKDRTVGFHDSGDTLAQRLGVPLEALAA